MKLNERVRRIVAGELEPGEETLAVVGLGNQLGTGRVSSGGAVHGSGSTALGTPYAQAHGLDLDNPKLRADLLQSWMTVTDRRLLFHKPKQTSIRPTPGALIESIDRDGVLLHWFDVKGYGLSNRVIHLEFPDGRHLVSATMLKASLRRKPFNDEPFLLVEAFGVAATEVAVA